MCRQPHSKDKNVALFLKASASVRPHANVPQIPSKAGATGGAEVELPFLFIATHGNPT